MDELTLAENVRDNAELRSQFYEFIGQIFPSADFLEWYDRGFWSDKFIPYSLLEENKIISNVCASKMTLLINGEPVNAIQFGAVGTLPEYRNRGLSKYLMDLVLNEYHDWADLYFLFANDTVVDFYPQFGFEQHYEVFYKLESELPVSSYSARKLTVDNDADSDILSRLLKNRMPLTKLFGAVNYERITMWHVLNIYRENIYYLENEEIVFFITRDDKNIDIWDVVYKEPFDLAEVLPKIIEEDTTSVNFHFPPDTLNFKYDSIEKSDTLLFIKGEFNLSGSNFKFPTTAQT